MTFTGGQVLGAISGQPSGEPARPVGGEVGREVPRERWREFLDAFSRNHNGWMINIEVLDRAEGPHIEVEDRAFEGISADDAAGEHTISVFSGRTLGEHLAHLISRPRRLHLLRADELEIEDEDGNITRVRLRSREQRAA